MNHGSLRWIAAITTSRRVAQPVLRSASDCRLRIGAGGADTAARGPRALQFEGDPGYPTPRFYQTKPFRKDEDTNRRYVIRISCKDYRKMTNGFVFRGIEVQKSRTNGRDRPRPSNVQGRGADGWDSRPYQRLGKTRPPSPGSGGLAAVRSSKKHTAKRTPQLSCGL